MTVKNVWTLTKENHKAGPSFDLFHLIVTLLVGAVAAGLVMAQFSYTRDPNSQLSLANLDHRVGMLKQTDDPVQRDSMCIPLAANARRLNELIPPKARIYITGMAGPTNEGALGYYFFFRNYLFPRDVEITLDKGHFGKGGFYGKTADSPDVLRSNGFDLVIIFNNNQMQFLPLTTNGVPVAPKSQ